MMRPPVSSLDCFFKPSSIAVIGASRTPGRPGYTLVENLKQSYRGRVFPVNAQANEIAGLPAFRTVDAIPDEVELAVVLLPAAQVPEAVRQCAAKGVKGVVVEAADFAEIGPAGKALQDDITAVSLDAGMRLWGPNCLGVIDTQTRVVTTYQPLRNVQPGRVSLVTQSGSLAGAVLAQIHEGKIFSFNKVCSIGNKADVNETDLLEYLGDDPTTEIIAMYLESITDGRRFIELSRRIAAKKPIIVLKSGRTALGVTASLGHTASLAGNDDIVDAAFAEAGIVRVGDIGDFLSVVKAFDRLHRRRAGSRIAVVCSTGAGGVLAADQLGLHGLTFAKLSSATMARLYETFPDWLKPDQPLDISPTMMKLGPDKALQTAVDTVLADDGVDALLLQTFGLPATASFTPADLAAIAAKHNKAAVAWLYGTREFLEPWSRTFDENNLPVLADLRSAALCLKTLADWKRVVSRPQSAGARVAGEKARVSGGVREDSDLRTLAGHFRLLESYGIGVAPGQSALTAGDAKKSAATLGYPVALKTADLAIQHKTEAGGVRLKLHTGDEVLNAAAQILDRLPGAGLYVQKMMSGDHEVIISGLRDPQFGPVVMVGLGGLWVEAFKDVVFGLAPLDETAAKALVEKLRAYPVLTGLRGRPPADIKALATAVASVGRLMCDCDQIGGVEINPFLLGPMGAGGHAVDVVITLANSTPMNNDGSGKLPQFVPETT